MRILISDYHAGCQLWQLSIIEYLNHTVYVNSFSSHSHLIDRSKIANITPCAHENLNVANITPILTYEEITNVSTYDTIIVSFPPKFIDLYNNVKTKYPKILNCGHRLHIHCLNDSSFINSIIKRVNDKEIILCSMSEYDTQYIKHYTGIKPIELYVTCFHIPNVLKYSPSRDEILISPVHASSILPFNDILHMNFLAKNKGYDFNFVEIKKLYNNYSYKDLTNHKATVLFPYSVFSISMIEMYELNIPMFIPSDRLIMETGIMNDVSLYPCYGSYEQMKSIDFPHIDSPHKFSPNSINYEDKLYWLKFCYFNTKKNIIRWDGIDELFYKLKTIDLEDISNKMRNENYIEKSKQIDNWKNLLESFN